MRLLPYLAFLLPHLAIAAEPTGEIQAHVYILSRMYGIEEELIHAIVKTESNYDTKAIGKRYKERGLMQLRPTFFPKAKLDVASNLRMGVKYLAKVREICYPKYADAWFVCYNTGPYAKKLAKPTLHSYYRKVQYAKKEQAKAKIHARSIAQSEGMSLDP